MPNDNEEKKNGIELLDGLEENPYAGKTTDIHQTIFQQVPRFDSQKEVSKLNAESSPQAPVFQKPVEVKRQEKREKSKKIRSSYKASVKIPLSFVVFLVLLINVVWLGAVYFVLIPDYEEYKANSVEMQEKIEYLERSVKAIVGE